MVARLKLKEIDGRAPPGVRSKCRSSAPDSTPAAGGGVLVPTSCSSRAATPSNCGELLKPLATKLVLYSTSGWVNNLGTVITREDATMDDPHPSPYGLSPRGRFRDLTGVGSCDIGGPIENLR